MNKKIFFITFILIGLAFIPLGVLAGAPGPGTSPSIQIENPISVSTIQEFVAKVLDIVVTISTPFLVVMFIYSGFLFVWARGKDTELKKAKDVFFYTVIGAALVLGAFILATAIDATINQLKRQPGVTGAVEVWRG